MSKVADSEELQAKIGEEIDAAALIALGAECGCEFTAEELQEAAELSDEELDTVAAGANRKWWVGREKGKADAAYAYWCSKHPDCRNTVKKIDGHFIKFGTAVIFVKDPEVMW